MPVAVKVINKMYRVVEKNTGKIAKTKNGRAVDGGGHISKNKALRQVRAINSNIK